MSDSNAPTKARKVARGIGGFVLFLASYSLTGAIAAALIEVLFVRRALWWAPLSDGSALDMAVQLFGAVLAGYLGVVLGSLVLNALMKDYPARGIGVAFVTWLLTNYLVHFLFFPNSHIPSFEVYGGLLQSSVAVATAWFVFRLPPLAPPKSLEKGLPQTGMASPDALNPKAVPPNLRTENRSRPFYVNTTREGRSDWFARTPPWDRVASSVIDAILDGITDEVLLEAFVLTSMEHGLVARYEPLGREGDSGSEIIRAQISHILCQLGNRAVTSLAQALKANKRDTATTAFGLANNTFEPAIALARNQIAAYAGLAAAWGMVGKQAECHDYAKRGLVELAEMRRLNLPFHKSSVIPADALDRMERQLRSYLEC